MKRDNAFTGLEAAIVLIAFVVVAAVFSYVMLGAGFFATQKAQEVTYAGIKQATSNVVFEGMMYGNVSKITTGDALTGFTFSIKIPGGGQAIDMSNTDFVFTSTHVIPPLSLIDSNGGTGYASVKDQIKYPGDTSGDQGCAAFKGAPTYKAYFPLDKDSTAGLGTSVMQPGQTAIYTVCFGDSTSDDTKAKSYLKSDDWFSLEMIPQIGAPTLVTKRIDAGLQNGKPLL